MMTPRGCVHSSICLPQRIHRINDVHSAALFIVMSIPAHSPGFAGCNRSIYLVLSDVSAKVSNATFVACVSVSQGALLHYNTNLARFMIKRVI